MLVNFLWSLNCCSVFRRGRLLLLLYMTDLFEVLVLAKHGHGPGHADDGSDV